mgnify:CR=1 FL=1
MHIFFQNDVVMTTTVAYRRNAIPCYTDNTEKKVPKRTKTPGKFKLHIYRTITNTNRKRQIEIYIYTNKQTNKKQRNKFNKSIYLFI